MYEVLGWCYGQLYDIAWLIYAAHNRCRSVNAHNLQCSLLCFLFVKLVYVAFAMHLGPDLSRLVNAHMPRLMFVDLGRCHLANSRRSHAMFLGQCIKHTIEFSKSMCTWNGWCVLDFCWWYMMLADVTCQILIFHICACKTWMKSYAIGRRLLPDANMTRQICAGLGWCFLF